MVDVTEGMGEYEEEKEEGIPIERSSEQEFVMIMGYVIHKFLDGELIVNHKEFSEFFDEPHSLERIDEDGVSTYIVKGDSPND